MKLANQLPLTVICELANLPRGSHSLVNHLTQAMRQAILDGKLPGGTLLPGTRILAEACGIGRSSIVEVIDQLAMEGYLETRQGAPTRVAAIDDAVASRKLLAPKSPVTSNVWILDDPPSPVTTRAFRPGLPELRNFPKQEWATLIAKRCRQPISHDLSYANLCGLMGLREALLVHLRQTRGVLARPEQLIVVPSAQAAFAILTQACLESGDVAWVEDPGYPGIRSVLRSKRIQMVNRPVDTGGLVVKEPGPLRPKLIYTTPSHQYPTGVTMPLQRRLELLDYAHNVGAIVIEDECDSDYQYQGRAIASLQGLDPHGCVAYVGTFSKTLAPGLRMAYLVVPPHLAALVETVATVSGYAVPTHLQLAMTDFLSGGGFQKHLRRVTTEAGARITTLERELRRAQEPRLTVPIPEGGLQLCVRWSGQTPDTEIASRLLTRDVYVLPLSSLCHACPQPGFVMGVGLVQKEEIPSAVERFVKTLGECA